MKPYNKQQNDKAILMLANSELIIMLNQSATDRETLADTLYKLMTAKLEEVENKN